MKIITWNCQGAFRMKSEFILAKRPDILVVQECEHPDKLFHNSAFEKPKNYYWYGDNKHKGICIFSYSEFKFELLDNFNLDFKYILPFCVTGNGQRFTLFAIWAMNNKINREARYIGQIWLAINYYRKALEDSCLLIGDFNSNKIWDNIGRVGNHSDVVEMLASKNIFSVYHKYLGQKQGEEKQPTFFLQRNKTKQYHIDYCFASFFYINKIENVEVGSFDDWGKLSDHTPLMINFDL